MDNQKLIDTVAAEIKQKLDGEGSGHDWWHVYRVWKMAIHIGEKEGADMLVVNLGALLHDIADWKFNDGDFSAGPRAAAALLEREGAPKELIDHVVQVVDKVTYKGAGVDTTPATLEGKVVQDADRLDALGAIGIGRAFAYGGHKGRAMHDPGVKPMMHATAEEYKKNNGPTINHFYEKLFLLKDRLNTETAKKIAQDRHAFMEEFVSRFLNEWEGKV